MAYVVTAPCFGCKYTDCVVVCPTECFHEGEKMLYVDPSECIDCDACASECPVEAIFHEDNVPEQWRRLYCPERRNVPAMPSDHGKETTARWRLISSITI